MGLLNNKNHDDTKEALKSFIQDVLKESLSEFTDTMNKRMETLETQFKNKTEGTQSEGTQSEGKPSDTDLIAQFVKELSSAQTENIRELLGTQREEKTLDDLFEEAFKED